MGQFKREVGGDYTHTNNINSIMSTLLPGLAACLLLCLVSSISAKPDLKRSHDHNDHGHYGHDHDHDHGHDHGHDHDHFHDVRTENKDKINEDYIGNVNNGGQNGPIHDSGVKHNKT